MRKEELRIGNWVKVEDGNIIRLDRHDMIGLLTNCYNVNPIPLTEEILLNCGFFHDEHSDTFKISNCTLQLDVFSFEEYDCIVFGESLIQIKHLHQLQNLYFSLTGEELKIEL